MGTLHRVTFIKASGGKAEEPVQCDLRVNNGGSTDIASTKKDSSELAAKSAKDYLEELKVLEFVQGVLHAVIKARPEDPIAYISTLCTYTDTNSRGEKVAKPQAANAGPATVGEGKVTKKAEATKQKQKAEAETKPQSEAKK